MLNEASVETAPLSAEAAPPITAGAAERSLNDDLRLLAQRGKHFAEAELAYQRARGTYAAGQVGNIALYGALAVVFVFFALMALTVGLVIAFTPLLTAWGATALVTGVLLVAALICARSALRRWRTTLNALTERKP